jgi:hypothetical protein
MAGAPSCSACMVLGGRCKFVIGPAALGVVFCVCVTGDEYMGFLKKSMLFLLGAISLAGCASTVQVNVRHAPELGLGAVKTVKIEKFTVQGGVNLNLSRNILLDFVGDVVVGGFVEPDRASLQDAHRQGLAAAIARNGYFQISDSDAANVRIDGGLDYHVSDHVTESEQKTGSVTIKTYTLARTANATVVFHVTDKSGKVLGSSKVSADLQRSWNGASEAEVRGQAGGTTGVVLEVLADTHDKVLQKIAPYYVTEQRTLRQRWSDQIKNGNKAAEQGNWQEAVQNWNAALSSGKQQDRVAAMYNLAVYDEVTGKLDDALKKYEEIYSLTKDSDDAKEVDRIKVRINEESALKQAENSRSASSSP